MTFVDLIREIPLFSGLDEPQLETIGSALRRKQFPSDTVILREGEQGDSLFILVDGSVEVSKRLGLVIATPEDGMREKMLVRLRAPQFFGEVGLLEDAERSATVRACGACDVLEISRADFERVAEADPLLGYHMLRNISTVLSARLRRTDHDVVKLTVALSLALGIR